MLPDTAADSTCLMNGVLAGLLRFMHRGQKYPETGVATKGVHFLRQGLAARMLTRQWVHVCTGVLSVVRSNVAQEKPYTGLTEIKTGEVGI